MFFKNYQLIFIFSLTIGTILAISSNSWITSWLGLEINLIRLIPLILRELNFKSTEAAIKYFLIQAIASIIIVAAATLQFIYRGGYTFEALNSIIFLALAIKTGIAPFHAWFPQVIEWIPWSKCFIILTWQKIAPFILMSRFLSLPIICILIMTSSFIGAAGGLNQSNRKIILTYSSIAHSSWILVITSLSIKLWAFYFRVYTITLIPIVLVFYYFNSTNLTEIYNSKISLFIKLATSSLILSLGGLPPFLGFSRKLTALIIGIIILPSFIFIILISSSLVSLFFYLKLFFNLLTSFTPAIKNLYLLKNIRNILFLTITGNLIISLLVLFS